MCFHYRDILTLLKTCPCGFEGEKRGDMLSMVDDQLSPYFFVASSPDSLICE